MNRFVTATAIAALLVSPALAQQTPPPEAPAQPGASPAAPAAAPAPAAGLPTVRHLVYQFGYNTPAADSGTGTGTTTIDIGDLTADGAMNVTATDNWWNTARPRQQFTCHVYPNGGVTCPTPPNAISPIQIALVPLLGRSYFTALASNPTATWQQTYDVKATFFPSANGGFTGQVYTWNGSYNLTGKGTVPNGAPLILVDSKGSMKQVGGRYIQVNQEAKLAYDPRISMPVLVNESITFVPRVTTNTYTVELKLIKTGQ